MNYGTNDSPVSQKEVGTVLGKCCLITLNTGAEAFYINGQFITDITPSENSQSLLNMAHSIATACGHTLTCYVIPEPNNDGWEWNDVIKQIVMRAHIDQSHASPPAPRGFIAKWLSHR